MDGKRLDLDAPLLSFRRRTVQADGEEVTPPPPSRRRRQALPFYNSDLKLDQVGIPGAVPFDWEKTPGQPKNSSLATTTFELNPAVPKLPPGRSLKENGTDWLKGALGPPEIETVIGTPTSSSGGRNEKDKVEDEDESFSTVCGDEDDAFSDARDAFSCAESFSMKCSMSAGVGAKDSPRSFTKDPQVKDFMMGRFLPAAQAMTEDSPQRTWRKPPRAQVDEGDNSGSQTLRRRRLPLDYQYQLSRAQLHGTEQADEEEEEEVEEYDDDYGSYAGTGFFSSKACGLIQRFCLKSSIGPFNSVPGLKAQGRPQPRTRSSPPQINVLRHASLGQAEDEDSWEAVYRYKLSHGYYPHRRDGSKLMTESNQLTSWSDSQMLDGSSFLNSTGGALSPDKHEDSKRESGSWKTGSSDLCEKGYGSYWETTYRQGRLEGSGSTSPATERPLNQNSLSLPETPDCKSLLANIPSDAKAEFEIHQTEESSFTEASEGYALQSRSSKIAEPGFSSYRERLNDVELYVNEFDNNKNNDDRLTLKMDLIEKNDNSLALPLLPPPLPTSPSESWLRRTLPSVPHQASFLGIQIHSKKQESRASAGAHKSVTYEKPSNLHPRRTRFVEAAKDM
ncbi:hypothetical protein MA16_Dca024816 [Dendrobium catenatum]|uniref:Uncharacterized protein n=1 Tax=Dendrobium catenatum TaxID=906689 RepID=A0A2I0VD20_9ASPA|nr:hypothetical protein MA16_Dca024816 [Dendrobium catenatum]